MTAAMKGSINFSIPDGWVPEFAIHGKNSFTIEAADQKLEESKQNAIEAGRLYSILEKEIAPIYYQNPEKWFSIMSQGWEDVVVQFDSNRMARETKLISCKNCTVGQLFCFRVNVIKHLY